MWSASSVLSFPAWQDKREGRFTESQPIWNGSKWNLQFIIAACCFFSIMFNTFFKTLTFDPSSSNLSLIQEMERSGEEMEMKVSILPESIGGDQVPVQSCNPVCPFSALEINSHRAKSATKLGGLIIFCLLVMVVEIIGGNKANSLAIFTDAAHLLTDVIGLTISLSAVWASGWEATTNHSFGFSRLEVLGALISVQLIWLLSGVLVYEAFNRMVYKANRINGGLMFGIAAFGFIINLIMVLWLGHDHSHHDHGHDPYHSCHHHHHHSDDEVEEELSSLAKQDEVEAEEEDESMDVVIPRILNINLQGAYLHVIADLIQSTGVMVAGAIIWKFPNWIMVDLIATLLFSIFVVGTTIPLLSKVFSILMEGTPGEVDPDRLMNGLKHIQGVCDVHDLHVWSITSGKVVMSCHVLPESGVCSSRALLDRIRNYCNSRHRIHHVTVQIE